MSDVVLVKRPMTPEPSYYNMIQLKKINKNVYCLQSTITKHQSSETSTPNTVDKFSEWLDWAQTRFWRPSDLPSQEINKRLFQ